jgi:hypothetical protein
MVEYGSIELKRTDSKKDFEMYFYRYLYGVNISVNLSSIHSREYKEKVCKIFTFSYKHIYEKVL